MRVEIWSDLVCPWCYVGKRRFGRALEGFPHKDEIEIVHRAYLLYSAFPRGTTFDRREMLMKKYGLTHEQAESMNAEMERTAAADGLKYHLAGGVTGNTFDAHQVIYLACARGRQDAALERIYRAYFTEQRSIFSEDSLVALGVESGLDGEEVRRALRENAYAKAVEADLAKARSIRISGVPFFVFDRRYVISGAQRPEVFAEALARASDDARGESQTVGGFQK